MTNAANTAVIARSRAILQMQAADSQSRGGECRFWRHDSVGFYPNNPVISDA